MKKLLIANRGEIALRVQRAARDLGIATVAVYASDDAGSRHRLLADEAVALQGEGAAAYLDIDAILAAARASGCDAIHPGYGFLSERADFASACAAAQVVFVGPEPAQLALFGDKGRALALAARCGVPVMPATPGGATLDAVTAFFDEQDGAGVVLKAVGGGGGRGMRVVRERDALPEAYARCRSEARSAFGIDALYAERLVARARHIEVQIAGDGDGVIALGERDCTLQRRFQKVVEIAPSPALDAALRQRIVDAACTLAREARYRSLGTFEFLVEEPEHGAGRDGAALPFVFIEANPRLQVEHTVTEQVTGIDLVAVQLGLAQGRRLSELGLDPRHPPRVRGYAIQVRVNAEATDAQGLARPAQGRLERFDPPTGPDVRVDTHGYTGYAPSAHYDTLLAKLIVTSASDHFADAVRRLQRALAEFNIAGIATNLDLLRALAERDDFASQQVHTRYMETALPALLERAAQIGAQHAARHALAGAAVAPVAATSSSASFEEQLGEGLCAVRAPMNGRVIELARENDVVTAGQTVAVLDAMKMEHAIVAEQAGRVIDLRSACGEQVAEGQVMLVLEPADAAAHAAGDTECTDPAAIRPDLQRVLDRHAFLYDAARPEAVARRRARGQRTARENVDDLCDAGSFREYGGLALAAQASRRSEADLIANTPADGLITGTGTVNGSLFAPERARCAVLAYDATVLAGTQGKRNHTKTDRILEVALRNRLPTVIFAEGGGGRPGDVDFPTVAGLYQPSFGAFAELSGEVPVVGIASGRCFAGNAALLGCCDLIVATRNANIGMAGPAMIEGGGLGVFRPEDIGPAAVQYHNGVADLLVDDEAAAVAAAKHYLSMFQGRLPAWQAPDPLALRQVVPENRLRVYDTRAAIDGLADIGSVLELRAGFGTGIHTALARIEGRPVGILANNPRHLGGAIDADAADKAARFMQVCNAHGLPIVSLIDTPGFMVGPEVEARAQVRHVSRMFVIGAKLRVPFLAVVLRKGYGLGAMAMAAGGFRAPSFTVSWPTGEFGGMGLEGAVRLGFRKELEALPAGPQRDALYQQLVAQMYERGHAINAAAALELDAVIDPAATRQWLVSGLDAGAADPQRSQRPIRAFVDAW
ncbi:acetyl-CoA carboxylase family protein [Cupriavidus taiwanensis]|uniref:acetyl-CoA carboxylase family protein n=1 Tax=Cupriavidus taiwanensis TaxID=164546 RepID=UPI000E106816|nr:carboxyl transferase domain-containing protein [Cupriavidus taiwanensis]SOY48954.1 Acetyl-CoA carboxylase (Biotin carboxylase and carboxyl transferase domains) [Cupriavidus taiwanensis]SOY49090.1 Acetyl-CoA carboxylase (Biotin carboxylase and carboxyl transferase domains) [Cupriavidus taiwanensis]SOY83268.1 Acetyl-CoA carboxylase (Biotin carboxylase and carboxyl transferase domains) [Cupriavidus taiwanensis]SOZ57269.1 Acetyl-CoA carboxylase (Biotin carboxylase and carboxyl transferase domain